MKKKQIILHAIALLGLAGVASAQTMTPAPAATATSTAASTNKDLAGSAALSTEHTTLLTALKAAGLAEQAKAKGPFTVFAPDNAAFAKLPAGTVDNLLKPANKKQLSKILTYHVVPGNVMAADLKDGQTIKTVQGESLTVSLEGGTVTIRDAKGGSATVTTPDIKATNGTVHSIDAVLMPAK
ncbi:fasciclin domain-containing protein [Hymenobacter qilianensis]|uniref:Fasciclin domain-containing protein n=2 Tax=Hymenobacter qilianensis TaxID=1385715 RepID=A0A7H0GXQ0_9BACT|nr:fasciclin domain-containing protein [Hymenobacter qilianensis]QNP53066.1 fasciclin domain-containing protein [Hymenobacter qilianensis]